MINFNFQFNILKKKYNKSPILFMQNLMISIGGKNYRYEEEQREVRRKRRRRVVASKLRRQRKKVLSTSVVLVVKVVRDLFECSKLDWTIPDQLMMGWWSADDELMMNF